jgi:hypothetical protein
MVLKVIVGTAMDMSPAILILTRCRAEHGGRRRPVSMDVATRGALPFMASQFGWCSSRRWSLCRRDGSTVDTSTERRKQDE